MSFSHIVHDVDAYCSSSSIAVRNGVQYHANVINAKEGQYIVITEVRNGVSKELKRLYAVDSRAMLLQEGADPALDNGKYGNVDIDIEGSDIHIIIELRVNGVNKPRWGILRGLVT